MQETALEQRPRLSATAVIWITGFAFAHLHIASSSRYEADRDFQVRPCTASADSRHLIAR